MTDSLINSEHINNLHRLINWLNSKTKITGDEPEIAAARKKLYEKLLDNPGKTLGEISGLPTFYQYNENEFKKHLRTINDDLDEQLLIFEGFAKRWFENGDQKIPPHYTDRIATILRKAKLFDEEKEFLEAYFRHFWSVQGSVKDQKIGERAKKIGINIPTIPSSSIWYREEERRWAKDLSIENLSINIDRKSQEHNKTTVEFYCLQCGSTVIDVRDPDSNESHVKCKKCHTHFGTWGSIKELSSKISKKYMSLYKPRP